MHDKMALCQCCCAGYVFCCSGVFVYQYIKYHEARKAVKGHPAPSTDLESGTKYVSNSTAPSTAVLFSRSKADVMSEMQRLQDELTNIDGAPSKR